MENLSLMEEDHNMKGFKAAEMLNAIKDSSFIFMAMWS